MNRDRGRADTVVAGHRTNSRNRLSSESSSGADLEQADVRLPRHVCDRGGQLACLGRLQHEPVALAVERDAADRLEPDERPGEGAAVVGLHEHVAGPVVHRIADRPMVAGRGEPSVDHDDDALGKALDLVEHVRADDHRAAFGAELLEQGDQGEALHRVGAVERLVEHEHRRVAHERRRDLRPLAHALAEPVDAAVGGVEHADLGQRRVRRAAVGDAVQVGDVANELAGGERRRDRLVLRHDGDLVLHRPVRGVGRGRRHEPRPGSRRRARRSPASASSCPPRSVRAGR